MMSSSSLFEKKNHGYKICERTRHDIVIDENLKYTFNTLQIIFKIRKNKYY